METLAAEIRGQSLRYNLTPEQKRLVEFLVKAVGDGSLTDEFVVQWSEQSQGSSCLRRTDNEEAVYCPIHITEYKLDLLHQQDLLDCKQIYPPDARFARGVREIGWRCALTGKAYEAVKANFVSNVLPPEIENVPQRILEQVPGCDDVIPRYVEEAIACVKADALLAATMMLGIASEKAIILLIETYVDSIADSARQARLRGKIDKNWMISRKLEAFQGSYSNCKNRPTDPELKEVEQVILQMATFFRITRNEVGHPVVIPNVEKSTVLANIGHFVKYVGRIYGLMSHFTRNKVIL